MQATWEKDTTHARFWKELLNSRLDGLLNDPEATTLKLLRYDHKLVRYYQRRFGPLLKERGLNLYELIAKACGEVWDVEDEEKGGVLKHDVEKTAPMTLKEDEGKCRRLGSPM